MYMCTSDVNTLPRYTDLFFGVVTSEDRLETVHTEITEEADKTCTSVSMYIRQTWVKQPLKSLVMLYFTAVWLQMGGVLAARKVSVKRKSPYVADHRAHMTSPTHLVTKTS